jgi:uncharacterized protein (DUF433 family)
MPGKHERPPYAGVYPVIDAALYIRATTPDIEGGIRLSTLHLYRWVREGLAGEYLQGLRERDVALTFLDLITLRAVAIFRAHGIKSREIKTAHQELRKREGSTHPFAMQSFWMMGSHIYKYSAQNQPVAVSARWQSAFDFIAEYLKPAHNLEFNSREEPTSWEPLPGVLLDPRMSFGAPCVKGTRVATETLWALTTAGDPLPLVADAYGLSLEQVESAIAWENKLERIAA